MLKPGIAAFDEIDQSAHVGNGHLLPLDGGAKWPQT